MRSTSVIPADHQAPPQRRSHAGGAQRSTTGRQPQRSPTAPFVVAMPDGRALGRGSERVGRQRRRRSPHCGRLPSTAARSWSVKPGEQVQAVAVLGRLAGARHTVATRRREELFPFGYAALSCAASGGRMAGRFAPEAETASLGDVQAALSSPSHGDGFARALEELASLCRECGVVRVCRRTLAPGHDPAHSCPENSSS
jgi:hypothetical protein